jgi:hypothetical protein
MQWAIDHPAAAAAIAMWFFNNVITVMVSALPAPTKDNSQKYVFFFKVTNTLVGNVARAHSTAIELSPNWQAAIEKHIDLIAGMRARADATPTH